MCTTLVNRASSEIIAAVCPVTAVWGWTAVRGVTELTAIRVCTAVSDCWRLRFTVVVSGGVLSLYPPGETSVCWGYLPNVTTCVWVGWTALPYMQITRATPCMSQLFTMLTDPWIDHYSVLLSRPCRLSRAVSCLLLGQGRPPLLSGGGWS